MDGSELRSLVSHAAAGDVHAWEELVDRFGKLVWAVARGHCSDPADAADVSQTTWLRLLEALPSMRDPSRVRAWLITTTRREALRLLRTRRSEPSRAIYGEMPEIEDCTVGEAYVDRCTDAELWDAFERLPSNCKALMRALMAEPRPSYEALSQAFDIPIGSIGPTRARCLDWLRSYLVESGAVPVSEPWARAEPPKRRVS